uniref:protein-tyrosine-phosphatase n=1 Tax=Meloidogyne incognita TaxID=6306 RepID=A0A914MIY3_MELIC
MFNFLRNRFIAIAASSNYFGGEERLVEVIQQQKQQKRHLVPPTSGVNKNKEEKSVSSSSSNSYQQQKQQKLNKMTEINTTIDSNLMDEKYFLNKFDEYEKEDSWDKVFSKVNSESDSQAKKLSLCCNLSNNFHEKNRYRNVLPYDQNRIKLQSASSEHEAYINASPLELPFAKRNYILTQGPLPNTTGDFWQMIYEQNVSICIMLSKVMEKSFVKCHSYFPHKDSPKSKFDRFECLLEHEEIRPNYIIRRLCLKPLDSFKQNKKTATNNFVTPSNSPTKSVGSDESGGGVEGGENIGTTNLLDNSEDKSRIIHHFQFTTWPDFGVPEDTDQFLEFLEEVRRTREMLLTTSTQNQKEIISLEAEGSSQSNNPPIVCHCSAGIGRTGTFVIVDSVLSMIEMNRINKQNLLNLENNNGATNNSQILTLNKEEGAKHQQKQNLNSLESLVVFIRKHRMGLIQTPQQLRFCWKTIVDWINKQQQNQKQQQFPSSPKSPLSATTTTSPPPNNGRSSFSPPSLNHNSPLQPTSPLLSSSLIHGSTTTTTNSTILNVTTTNITTTTSSPLSSPLHHQQQQQQHQPVITSTTTPTPTKSPTKNSSLISPKNNQKEVVKEDNNEEEDDDERMSTSTSRGGSSSHLSLVLSSSDNFMY